MTTDKLGDLWVGEEDQGVWRFDARAAQGKQWTQFTAKDGLGDDDVSALACDQLGRVWAGTLNHGVSVWNGKTWKTYDRLTGPLGAHVTALAVSPLDGSVWGATEAGLFRYAHDKWTYFTRAEGLPSDQANALAFDKHGTLYVGTACDGLAIASASGDYKAWRRVTGPNALPNAPSGKNLPSNLVNALLLAKDGAVYVGTDCGLAYSRDGGKTWAYVRGRDWLDKLKGMAHPPETVQTPVTDDLLLEDYVTALAEDAAGHIWVGHRRRGAEALEATSLGRVYPTGPDKPSDDYIAALLPRQDGPMLAGRYGGGLTQVQAPSAIPVTDIPASPTVVLPVSFPATAKAPDSGSLQSLVRQVRALQGELSIGGAVYLGEDWATQGDWVGRYGRQYARLCAMQAPWGDHVPFAARGYMARPGIGPHHREHDALRSWVTWVKTDNPKSLYDPQIGYRRQAEHDDHGEDYADPQDGSFSYEGPDLWYALAVPEGVHRVSAYFVNKDAQGWPGNRCRDYLVQIKPYREQIKDADALPALAQGRVRRFWGGVYEAFVVRGPSKYYLKVAKNNSVNALCSGVFIDRLTGTMAPLEDMGGVWLGDVRYDPPQLNPPDENEPADMRNALKLWSALETSYDKIKCVPLEQSYRLFAYRAIANEDNNVNIATAWRWKIHLWNQVDRNEFSDIMNQAHQSLLYIHPNLKTVHW